MNGVNTHLGYKAAFVYTSCFEIGAGTKFTESFFSLGFCLALKWSCPIDAGVLHSSEQDSSCFSEAVCTVDR